MPRSVRFALWAGAVLLIAIFAVAVRGLFDTPVPPVQDISFAQLLNDIDQGRVRNVRIEGAAIHGTFTDGRSFATYMPTETTVIARLCDDAKIVEIKGRCGTAQ
jgi:cell division protease FtsH